MFRKTSGFWNSVTRPESNANHAVECWEYGFKHVPKMSNNELSLDYHANKRKYPWVKSKFVPKERDIGYYQPFCCALSGITRATREAMTRLPEYILVGDPRRNIICRCICHSSKFKECDTTVMTGKTRCKVLIERPVVPVVSVDEIQPRRRRRVRRNQSNNNNVGSRQESKGVVAGHHQDMIVNLMTDVVTARYNSKILFTIFIQFIVSNIYSCFVIFFCSQYFLSNIVLFLCSLSFSNSRFPLLCC